MKRKVVFILICCIILFSNFVFGESIQKRFKNKDKIKYEIYFNGIPSGDVVWEYLGKKLIEGKEVDALSISSNTKILKLLNLTSEEQVFLDSKTYLPVKVERNVVLFGKKERIEEIYNQEEGYVKIIRRNSAAKEDILYQDKPIQNILALLYFFPDNIPFEKGVWMFFNLPNQKIKIKMVKEKTLTLGDEKRDTYFLIGRGARWFNLWLDKKNRLPLRVEFVTLAGKITIKRAES